MRMSYWSSDVCSSDLCWKRTMWTSWPGPLVNSPYRTTLPEHRWKRCRSLILLIYLTDSFPIPTRLSHVKSRDLDADVPWPCAGQTEVLLTRKTAERRVGKKGVSTRKTRWAAEN